MAENQTSNIKYNLADDVEDGFTFRIRKSNPVEFFLTYPLQSQVNKIAQYNEDIKSAEEEVSKELESNPEYKMTKSQEKKVKDAANGVLKVIHEFIQPVGHEEKIEDVLSQSSIRENQLYQDMLKTVFQGE